jgi:hypothetical protein
MWQFSRQNFRISLRKYYRVCEYRKLANIELSLIDASRNTLAYESLNAQLWRCWRCWDRWNFRRNFKFSGGELLTVTCGQELYCAKWFTYCATFLDSLYLLDPLYLLYILFLLYLRYVIFTYYLNYIIFSLYLYYLFLCVLFYINISVFFSSCNLTFWLPINTSIKNCP